MTLPAGTRLPLTIGPVAHGGHCVARVDDDPHGRVVFVRHTAPGEQVIAEVTEDGGGGYLRADAVHVRVASADRVVAPCAHAGPGGCGGCDWQHLSPAAVRELKAQVVAELFARIAGLTVDPTVEELPGGALGWRTRTLYAADPEGVLGLRRHRSHSVERISHCPLGTPGVGDSPALAQSWPGCSGVEVVRGDGELTVLTHRPGRSRAPRGTGRRGHRRAPDVVEVSAGESTLTRRASGRAFRVSAAGFWQVHPAAPDTFADAVLEALAPSPGERVLDLYAGAGLFTALFGECVGPTGQVIGVEADAQAVSDARLNIADQPWSSMMAAAVNASVVLSAGKDCAGTGPELVFLDPPRAGAGAEVMHAVLASAPRLVGYLACDPASLARDVATALAAGWRLKSLRAFDAFPMTHHVECLAILQPPAR